MERVDTIMPPKTSQCGEAEPAARVGNVPQGHVESKTTAIKGSTGSVTLKKGNLLEPGHCFMSQAFPLTENFQSKFNRSHFSQKEISVIH